MTLRFVAVMLWALGVCCAPADDGLSGGPEFGEGADLETEAEIGMVDQAVSRCGANTVSHWPDPPRAKPISQPLLCTSNAFCNGVGGKPLCAAGSDNTCLCTERSATGQCISSQCLWHVDPRNLSCVCVPGSIQRCTRDDGSPGIEECGSTGTSWGPCE
jgi:hypothetical protein